VANCYPQAVFRCELDMMSVSVSQTVVRGPPAVRQVGFQFAADVGNFSLYYHVHVGSPPSGYRWDKAVGA
jgi:hypothetical protein